MLNKYLKYKNKYLDSKSNIHDSTGGGKLKEKLKEVVNKKILSDIRTKKKINDNIKIKFDDIWPKIMQNVKDIKIDMSNKIYLKMISYAKIHNLYKFNHFKNFRMEIEPIPAIKEKTPDIETYFIYCFLIFIIFEDTCIKKLFEEIEETEEAKRNIVESFKEICKGIIEYLYVPNKYGSGFSYDASSRIRRLGIHDNIFDNLAKYDGETTYHKRLKENLCDKTYKITYDTNNNISKNLKIRCISDTHEFHNKYKVKDFDKTDVLVHTGDIFYEQSRCSYEAQIEILDDFVSWLNKIDFKLCLITLGNHDFYFDYEPHEANFREYCSKFHDSRFKKTDIDNFLSFLKTYNYDKIESNTVYIKLKDIKESITSEDDILKLNKLLIDINKKNGQIEKINNEIEQENDEVKIDYKNTEKKRIETEIETLNLEVSPLRIKYSYIFFVRAVVFFDKLLVQFNKNPNKKIKILHNGFHDITYRNKDNNIYEFRVFSCSTTKSKTVSNTQAVLSGNVSFQIPDNDSDHLNKYITDFKSNSKIPLLFLTHNAVPIKYDYIEIDPKDEQLKELKREYSPLYYDPDGYDGKMNIKFRELHENFNPYLAVGGHSHILAELTNLNFENHKEIIRTLGAKDKCEKIIEHLYTQVGIKKIVNKHTKKIGKYYDKLATNGSLLTGINIFKFEPKPITIDVKFISI